MRRLRTATRFGVAALLLSNALASGGLLAQEGAGERSAAEIDNVTAQVAAQLRCLVCRGQSVQESQAPLALEMKSVIRERLEAGDTPDEVVDYFLSRYGEYVLLQPRARGFNLLVYLLPVALLLIGGALVVRRIGLWSRPAEATAGRSPESDGGTGLAEDDDAWLERAIAER